MLTFSYVYRDVSLRNVKGRIVHCTQMPWMESHGKLT